MHDDSEVYSFSTQHLMKNSKYKENNGNLSVLRSKDLFLDTEKPSQSKLKLNSYIFHPRRGDSEINYVVIRASCCCHFSAKIERNLTKESIPDHLAVSTYYFDCSRWKMLTMCGQSDCVH